LEPVFEPSGQAIREAELDRFLESVQCEMRSLPRTKAERSAARLRINQSFERFARYGLDFGDEQLELLLRGGFSKAGTDLARQARQFDPAVSVADILQACRNAWTATGLQALLGNEMRLTPSIFAYSMLYPFSDNYLDDAAVSREDKLGFSERFGRRLAGEDTAPANQREIAIWNLISLIEGQYARAEWPQVFASLRAIHRAQQNSIRLLRSGKDIDILRLVFAKGGASVLADGYLAAGSLSEAEAQFTYDWGVVLQLADDLQDVREDRRDGVATLFSQGADQAPLDALISRTLQFAAAVMHRMHSGCQPLKDLIRSSSTSLIIRCAGEAGELCTQSYLAELEIHSPMRFAFLNDRRNRFARHRGLLLKLFEAFLEDDGEPLFPFLPGSLMPRL
jgi:hypothetical protein